MCFLLNLQGCKKISVILKTFIIFGIALLWAIRRYPFRPKKMKIGPSSGHFKNKKNWPLLGVKNFMTPPDPLRDPSGLNPFGLRLAWG